MSLLLLILLGSSVTAPTSQGTGEKTPRPSTSANSVHQPAAEALLLEELLQRITQSGRVFEISVTPSQRVSPPPEIAPGPPPFLGFRYLEGKRRHRFGNLDLMMDDAGH